MAEYISNSSEETKKIAKKIAKTLKPGNVMYLYGELGSGKTVFVKGICAGLGIDEEITSPSFVIATEYRGTLVVAHIDLYRLQRGQAGDLPIEEYILQDGVTVIEWADRIDVLKKGISVNIDIINRKKRVIKIEDLRN
ncbi:tRNA (adenosine(37)-N6)-threonylcarbamoyltransferase complex ATPase subunit type 1 TsaE [candidate division WOR-3 bacterium]|nr:tRNA (adenosine(37)-N6)-threonylcarbamoyltransferase complex ATPase subunit type 1 TsaE [candidate division WOR-3 bacterium]